ncbi:MAG: hypothetical protein CR986_06885 [Ignavibacteriae bacterium]|nr:MAG: hypothetical protein CR986_06885 [Ignavibacteriota bacterium]
MNILQIREKLDRGGIEVLLYDICKNAKKSGLNIYLSTFSKGELDEEFNVLDCTMIELKRKYPIDIKLVKNLRRIVIERDIDVIHTHQAIEALHAYLATWGLKRKVKNIISHHGSIYPMKDKFVMKFLIPRVSQNLAVSNSYLKRLEKEENFRISKNFQVLYNGIDQKKINLNGTDIKDELSLSKSTRLLGMVGNFYNTGRDQFTICQALVPLYKLYNDIHFIFIGGWEKGKSDSYYQCIEFCKRENIQGRVHFLGVRQDIGNILRQLDIFVYSSNHDTFGIAVVEAMLAGKPIVVNDIPAMLEITKDGEVAEIFNSKNHNSLYNSICKLLDNKEYSTKLAVKSKKWATDNFTIESHLKKLQKIYSDIS